MINQRKNRRCLCFVPVEGKEQSVFEHVRTVDFSEKGLGFVSPCDIPVNMEIPIELNLTAEGLPVFVTGKVVWSTPISNSSQYRVGVLFKDVFRGSKSRLDGYFKEIKQ